MYIPHDHSPDKAVPGPGMYKIPLNTLGVGSQKHSISSKKDIQRILTK